MILLAIAAVIVATALICLAIGHGWGYEHGHADALEAVDRWHARHSLPDYCLAARLDGPDHQPFLCQQTSGHDGAHRVSSGDWSYEW